MTGATANRARGSGRIRAGDTVVVVGPDAEATLIDALSRVGAEGAVVVVAEAADRLEALRRATGDDPRVHYLIGNALVLPLPDASADRVLASGETDVAELDRVLRRRS